MKDMNHVGLICRLTKDATLTDWNNSKKLDFSVAWNTTRKNGAEWIDESNYMNLCLFGKMAESLAGKMKKGTQVAIDGILKQNRWEKDGQKYSAHTIAIDSIQILYGGNRAESNTASEPSSQASFNDDDILF